MSGSMFIKKSKFIRNRQIVRMDNWLKCNPKLRPTILQFWNVQVCSRLYSTKFSLAESARITCPIFHYKNFLNRSPCGCLLCHARSMWEDLRKCETPLLIIFGEKDKKFKQIALQMHCEISSGLETEAKRNKEICETLEVPECGHAVHLENPLPVINAVRKFIQKLD